MDVEALLDRRCHLLQPALAHAVVQQAFGVVIRGELVGIAATDKLKTFFLRLRIGAAEALTIFQSVLGHEPAIKVRCFTRVSITSLPNVRVFLPFSSTPICLGDRPQRRP